MQSDIEYRASEIAGMIDLQPSRTRELLKMLVESEEIESHGEKSGRRYVRKGQK